MKIEFLLVVKAELFSKFHCQLGFKRKEYNLILIAIIERRDNEYFPEIGSVLCTVGDY